MSQAKLNEFFSTRKRCIEDHQPSKRRKIESKQHLNLGTMSSSNSSDKNVSQSLVLSGSKSTPPRTNVRIGNISRSNKQLPPTSASAKKNSNQKKLSPSQTKLTDLFQPQSKTSDSSRKHAEQETLERGFTCVTEEVTSIQDDHHKGSFEEVGQVTPRKGTVEIEIGDRAQSKTRRSKTASRKLNSASSGVPFSSVESAKKKLNLPAPENEKTEQSCTSKEVPSSSLPLAKTDLLEMVSDLAKQPTALSPMPVTPERSEDSSSPEPAVDEPSPKLKNLTQKLKNLSKMNGQALKNRLKQNGKWKELKEKTQALDSALKAKADIVQESPEVAEPVGELSLVPAYQRFEHLVAEGVPSLPLPFTYRVVENTFHAMDTVVSMMHNRSEMCTFSKIKAAVQNITKKNFEEKSVGQIKTVLPDAYIFRQETNIPIFGKKKSSDYQLTVEANLPQPDENDKNKTLKNAEGKPVFSASLLLTRKKCFKNSLIAHVKELHKKFLSSLQPRLEIPDEKLTRWHPKFQLDKLPEILCSDLPQAPQVRVYHSAKDVLESQKGKLNPRVEEALSKVALQSENTKYPSIPTTSSPKSPKAASPSLSSASPQSSPLSPTSATTSSLKGIPPALLAKIRAKEAAKMQQALTRDPVEEDKTRMMGHLPEMMRILRSFFVTEKKPALPLDRVYKKLEDSYRSGISRKEVEKHLNLLKELAPEFVSQVEVKQGKYLKLNKDVNTQDISNRILKLVKSRS